MKTIEKNAVTFFLMSVVLSCNAEFSLRQDQEARSMGWRDIDGGTVIYSQVDISDKYLAKMEQVEFAQKDGWLSVGGQRFYITDAKKVNDGATYWCSRRSGAGELEYCLEDLNGDGFSDIIFHGVVCYTGTVDQEIYEQQSVVFIYFCDVKQQKFILGYTNASFDLEVPNDASTKWWGRYFSDKGALYRQRDERKMRDGRVAPFGRVKTDPVPTFFQSMRRGNNLLPLYLDEVMLSIRLRKPDGTVEDLPGWDFRWEQVYGAPNSSLSD